MWGQELDLLQWVLERLPYIMQEEHLAVSGTHSITDSYLLLVLFLVAAFITAAVEGRNLNEIMGQKERFPGLLGCFHCLTMINHRL